MRVGPRCTAVASCFYLSLRSINAQQRATSLSDAVRNRVIGVAVVIVVVAVLTLTHRHSTRQSVVAGQAPIALECTTCWRCCTQQCNSGCRHQHQQHRERTNLHLTTYSINDRQHYARVVGPCCTGDGCSIGEHVRAIK